MQKFCNLRKWPEILILCQYFFRPFYWIRSIQTKQWLGGSRGCYLVKFCAIFTQNLISNSKIFLEFFTISPLILFNSPLVADFWGVSWSHNGQKDRFVISDHRAPKRGKKSWRETFGTIGVKVRSLSKSEFRKFDLWSHLKMTEPRFW